MNILITGGFGFIGKNLLYHFLNSQTQHDITVISRSEKPIDSNFAKIKHIKGSYSDVGLLKSSLKEIDLVIHLAYSSVPEDSSLNPIEDIKTNVVGTVNLLNSMVEQNVKKIIFLSSGGTVYGVTPKIPIDENYPENPISAYGVSKLAIEKYISFFHNLHDIHYCILRASNAYGIGQSKNKNQGVIPVWVERIINGEPINIIGDGSTVRDYIHIDDVCSAIKLCAENNLKNNIYNIGTCVETSLNEIVSLIEKKSGHKSSQHKISARKYDVPYNVLRYNKIHMDLGWKPKISIREGIESVVDSLTSSKN